MQMKDKLNQNIGAAVCAIRVNKNLMLKEVTGGLFTVSQLSRFEQGKSDLTISKFLIVLENLNVQIDEFQGFYDSYTQSDAHSFRKELSIAYATRDYKKIKEILKYWEQKTKKEPLIKHFKVNMIVISTILAVAQNSKVLDSSISFLMEYLDDIEEWGRYELWIFANCIRFFDYNALKYYGQRILSKVNFFRSSHQNEQIFLRTNLNLIDTWLYKEELSQALKYIKYLKEVDIKVDFFYEKIILKYHDGHYNLLFGRKKDGIDKMEECINTLRIFDFEAEAQVLENEVKLFRQ